MWWPGLPWMGHDVDSMEKKNGYQTSGERAKNQIQSLPRAEKFLESRAYDYFLFMLAKSTGGVCRLA